MQTARSETPAWRQWLVPALALFLGAIAWLADAIGGDPRGGAISFAVMVGYGLLLVVTRRRSDIASVLSGAAPDERYRAIDLQAVAVTGIVLILYVIGGFLWELAHGRSGMPYTLMGAIAGATYLAALVLGRLRS